MRAEYALRHPKKIQLTYKVGLERCFSKFSKYFLIFLDS